MKKFFILLSMFTLLNIYCSGGDISSSKTSAGNTTVTISLGETRASVQQTDFSTLVTSSIPVSVTDIRFMISAPDMATIERVVSVSGRTKISESFEVPNGTNRHFLVEAIDQTGIVIFKSETFADLSGEPVKLTMVMVSVDPIPPVFSGISGINSITTTSMVLSWLPASDNVTPQDKIQYLIYTSTASGGQKFISPNFTTQQGITSYTITGLNPNTTYYFVVRAMDERGNIDSNTVEISATTLPISDTEPPVFNGLISATALSSSEILLEWEAATDNISDSSKIDYLVYISTSSGEQNFATPNYASQSGATSFIVNNLAPGTTYYFVVRARDEAYNVDTNTVEKSATTMYVEDTVPPTFGGLASANAVSSSEIILTWNQAADNLSLPENIVYHIYMSASPGGQDFKTPTTSITGSTSVTISGLTPDTTYYFIARAQDEAGNMDSNNVEKSATTLPLTDTIPPAFGGLVSATAISSTSILLSWNPATDNITPSSDIIYYIFMSTTSGGENLSVPVAFTNPGETSATITGLSKDTTYYFIVRARDEAGNTDSNTIEKSATTLIDIDLLLENVVPDTSLISFDVKNRGSLSANDVKTCYIYDQHPSSPGIVEWTDTVIPPESSVSHSTDQLSPTGDFIIFVDPCDNIVEDDETNNTHCGGTYCTSPPDPYTYCNCSALKYI